jgi:hypothetical protein
MASNSSPKRGDVYLKFNGRNAYVEIPSRVDYSASTTSELTIAVWMRPDTINFPHVEIQSDYIHWLGKGELTGATGNQEWTFACITTVTRWITHLDRTGSAFISSTPRADWASAVSCRSQFTRANGFIWWVLRIAHARSFTKMANIFVATASRKSGAIKNGE